jgi:hypothetical protein
VPHVTVSMSTLPDWLALARDTDVNQPQLLNVMLHGLQSRLPAPSWSFPDHPVPISDATRPGREKRKKRGRKELTRACTTACRSRVLLCTILYITKMPTLLSAHGIVTGQSRPLPIPAPTLLSAPSPSPRRGLYSAAAINSPLHSLLPQTLIKRTTRHSGNRYLEQPPQSRRPEAVEA